MFSTNSICDNVHTHMPCTPCWMNFLPFCSRIRHYSAWNKWKLIKNLINYKLERTRNSKLSTHNSQLNYLHNVTAMGWLHSPCLLWNRVDTPQLVARQKQGAGCPHFNVPSGRISRFCTCFCRLRLTTSNRAPCVHQPLKRFKKKKLTHWVCVYS